MSDGFVLVDANVLLDVFLVGFARIEELDRELPAERIKRLSLRGGPASWRESARGSG